MLVHVEDGRVTRITGDKAHPLSRGFVCVKGARAHELHGARDRIHRPLARVGPRGGGKWREVGWDEALDDIAEQVRTLVAAHGAESVAYSFGTLHGADWGVGERFMNLLGSPNSSGQDKICYGPNALGETLTYGFGPSFFTAPTPGLTRCTVVWGMRPSASLPLLWSQIVAAHRSGTKLVVVDPERTLEARQADLWLQIRPGSDTALALGLLHVVIAEELYDRRFVEAHTIGFDDLARRVAEYSPARVAALTWVPADRIVEAARLIARNAPAIVNGGNGLCQAGTMAVANGRSLACLVAVTGNLGVPGGHALAGPPRRVVANGEAMLVDRLPDAQRAKRIGADRYPFLGKGYERVDAAMAPAWYGKRHLLSWIATAHEPSLWRAISSGRPYPVKALFVQHHNPLGSCANAREVSAALQHPNLELLVVHDLFVNATSRLADYLLPACHWLEKPYFSASYGYLGFAGDYADANASPLEPEGEHRSDYDLWRDLGRRLGQADEWPERAEEFRDTLLRPAGLSFDTLAERCGPVFGADAGGSPPTDPAESGRAFGTPSGKVELRSSLLEAMGCDPLPGYAQPGVFAHDPDSYPLVLTTGGRALEGFHQNAQQMPWFRSKHPDPVVRIHPRTAAALGIGDGEWVEIETPIGRVTQKARLSDALHPGAVQADRWWYPERGEEAEDPFGFWSTNINVCTDDSAESADPVFGTWLLRGLPCRLAIARRGA